MCAKKQVFLNILGIKENVFFVSMVAHLKFHLNVSKIM